MKHQPGFKDLMNQIGSKRSSAYMDWLAISRPAENWCRASAGPLSPLRIPQKKAEALMPFPTFLEPTGICVCQEHTHV